MQSTKRRLALVTPLVAVTLAAAACGSSGNGGGSNAQGTSGPSTAASGSSAPSNGASTATIPPVENVKDGGQIVYGADQEPTGFNNLTSKDNGTAATNVLEGVWPSVSYGTPALTAQFNKFLFTEEPKAIKDNPLTVEYKIKPEAVWSDGVPIDVEDFKLNWQAQNGTNKDFDVATTTGFEDIASVEANNGDKKDVIVTFKKNFTDWRALFSPFVPAHTIEALAKSQYGGSVAKAWNDGLDKSPMVSGGPYEVSEYKTGDSLTLTPNPKWYGDKPHLDKVIFKFLPESTTQPQALQNKEVQVIYPQPQLDLVGQVKQIPNVATELNFGLSFEHIDFNFKTPGLDDVNVRKAIATAISQKALIARTVGQFSEKAQPLGNRVWLTGQPQYKDNFTQQYGKGDTAAANKLLDDAGWVKGADGIRAKGGVKLDFKMTTTAGNKLRETTVQLVQAELKEIGINIRPDLRPSKVVFPDLSAHKFDISLFAWVGTPFSVSSNQPIYSSGSDSNYGQFSDPKVDDLFKQAIAEVDPAKSADLANQADAELTNIMATIPLYQKPTFIAYDSSYGNVHDNSTSDGPFWNVYQWGQKAS